MAIDPTSEFVYVSCAGLSTIDQFASDPTTGSLSALGAFSTGQFTEPRELAVDASGSFLFSALNQPNKAGSAVIGTTALSPVSPHRPLPAEDRWVLLLPDINNHVFNHVFRSGGDSKSLSS